MKNTHFISCHGLVYVFVIFLLGACAVPQPVIRMQPTEKGAQFFFGKEFITSQQDGVIVSMAFDANLEKQFTIDFEIINQSEFTILVDPANFYYHFHDSITDRNQPKYIEVKATNPETQILQADMEIARRIAQDKNQAAFAMGMAVLSVGLAIAETVTPTAEARSANQQKVAPDKETVNQQRFEKSQNAAALLDIANTSLLVAQENNVRAQFEVMNLNEKKAVWSQETLRKTHLRPNERLQGIIVFDKYLKSGHLTFHFPIEWLDFRFLYRQMFFYQN